MGLVILTALLVAAFIMLFKWFSVLRVPLLPVIAVNYLFAFLCSLVYTRPWNAGDLSLLWWPSLLIGGLFVSVFRLTGLSAQRSGVAITTVAGRTGLVLTVLVTVIVFRERPGAWMWCGIGLALVGLVLSAWSSEEHGNRRWGPPLLLFLGSGACDIAVSAVQRVRTTSLNEMVLPTLCFGAASIASAALLIGRGELIMLKRKDVRGCGLLLGGVNAGSLLCLVGALGRLPATTVFPLMNICAILIGTAASVLIFRERPSAVRWTGIGLCVLALLLILLDPA